jgi:hypothetical protein
LSLFVFSVRFLLTSGSFASCHATDQQKDLHYADHIQLAASGTQKQKSQEKDLHCADHIQLASGGTQKQKSMKICSSCAFLSHS